MLVVAVATATLVGSTAAVADSTTTTNAPLTCQTRLGAQVGMYSTTVTDDVDPVLAGGAVSYRFVTPFKQTLPGGLTGTYKGGQVFFHIPTSLTVSAVSTSPPVGGLDRVGGEAGQRHRRHDPVLDEGLSAQLGGGRVRGVLPR